MSKRVSLLLLPLLWACGEKPGQITMDLRHNPQGSGTAVATFAGDSITAEELERYFSEMSPYARARYQTPEQKKEYLEGLVRFELLVAEARKRGLAKDPEVIEATKKVMVQQLLKAELEGKPTPVSEAAVAEYYEKRKADYVKPEMIRLSDLFIAAAPDKAQKRTRAEEALQKARALEPLDFQGFGKLVQEYSEDERTKPLYGDLRFLSFEELAKEHGAPVAEAAKSLTQVGALSEALVETDQGFHVLKLQGRQAALNLGLDQVKPQIQGLLVQEQKMASYEKLLAALNSTFQPKIDEGALAKVKLDLKSPAAESKGPTPGYIPSPANAAR